MKRNFLFLTVTAILAIWSAPAFALPTLQLDISKGTYDFATQTITATDSAFTLYALLTPGQKDVKVNDAAALLAKTYYISAAISPQVNSAADLGSFTFNGAAIDVTADMVYGVPPLETNLDFDAGDLSKHDIFPTYFKEFVFTFHPENTVGAYNTQDNPGGFGLPGSGAFYAAFAIDTTGLLPGYTIHFDLYDSVISLGKKESVADTDVGDFAPYSHDAQSAPSAAPVPEPATILLLGSGLLGLVGISRKKLIEK